MFYLQRKHSCMHNAALTIQRRCPVNACQLENERRQPAASFNWCSDGSFWNGPNIIGRDRKCTLWCILRLRHFLLRSYLPPPSTTNTSLPLCAHALIFSSRPSDKTPSSLKAHKRTHASDPERNVSLKLDWPQLLYLVAGEQTHAHTQAWKKKHSFLKAGPRGPERQMGLRGEMERSEWSPI